MNKRVNGIKAPPIKIQGIKTKLVPFIMYSVKWEGKGRGVEPFVGSGVVVLNINPKKALLADTNEHIISFYRAIQSREMNSDDLRCFLKREGSLLKERGQAHYYELRERFNDSHSPFDFIFLNRACFNGMIRFNSKGEFNVPFCRKPDRFAQAYVTKICNQVSWAAERINGKDWQFVVQDWRDTLRQVEDPDFVYLDPPYNDRHTDYYNQWSDSDADELAFAVKKLKVCFAYSTWKQNKYRVNKHVMEHFLDFPMVTKDHFYHVGPQETLRNAMEEALIISPDCVADGVKDSMLPKFQEQLVIPF
jgi:DNA adenine methylase